MKHRELKYKKVTRASAERLANCIIYGDCIPFGVYGSKAIMRRVSEDSEQLIIRIRIYEKVACDGRHIGHLYDILCSACRRVKWKYFIMSKMKKNVVEVRFTL